MSGAIFERVPDFIQAHFEEAPRLDNLKVHGRWKARHPRPEGKALKEPPAKMQAQGDEKQKAERGAGWRKRLRAIRHAGTKLQTGTARVLRGGWRETRHFGGRLYTLPARGWDAGWRRLRQDNSSISARWRALKRLAIQGHDTERELDYHARELQSQRFETDWFLPHPFWRLTGWADWLRFISGFFYQWLSDFGRSICRPALFWFATVAVFALYFLTGHPSVAPRWQAVGGQGVISSAVAYGGLVASLWSEPPACYKGAAFTSEGKMELGKRYGLDAPMAETTNALREAVRLAFRNGSIFLDGGDDSARRTYGCLYGIQSFGGRPEPFVPGFATDASGLQKVLSALYIFLFGLALRNMLKMK
jgi:lipid-A-disaccharide synthase-like uncharacterized protein